MTVLMECLRSKELAEHLGLEVETKNGKFKGVGALQWAVPVGVFGDAACSLLPLGTLLGSCRAEKLGSSPSKHGETWSGGHLSAREAAGTAATSGAAAPPRARLRTDHSLFAWRGVLNLKELTQGFWSGDELGYHIIHLELDPVFPEGTEREDGVVEWGERTAYRFASDISTPRPSYFPQRRDPRCEGIDSLAHCWRGENNWGNPPLGVTGSGGPEAAGMRCHSDGGGATLVRAALVQRARGSRLRCGLPASAKRPVHSQPVGLVHIARDAVMSCIPGRPRVAFRRRAGLEPRRCPAIRLAYGWRCTGQTTMHGTPAPSRACPGNMRHVAYEYGSDEDLDLRRETYSTLLPLRSEGEPAEGLPWLPAVEEAVLPCPGSLPRRGTALAGSMQPHLSAINDYHEDLGFDGPAEGRPVVRVLKGRASIQAQVLADAGQQESERTWLPAEAVARVHGVVLGHSWGTDRDRLHLLRACVYSVVASCTFGRPEAGAGLQQQDVAASPEHIIFVLRRGKRGQQTVSGGSLGGAVLIGRGTWGRLAEAGPRGNFLYASGKPRGRAQYADPVHEVWILNGCGHDDAVSLMGSLDGETRGSPQHTNRGRRHADSRGLEGKRLEAASGKKTADPSLER
ncbi:hypothetical protein CYMTET_11993 [Cymbomonas tetramitiformis]|uniref:Uncharacterized protein n=1 Tax=Cymbomonas tetramitiformis TaxID=36881 RepID=A0AAE0GLC8_9CHLO|nr:hypothetical protein CYMTET_11993 [Cymbomonas tetramitiformis]